MPCRAGRRGRCSRGRAPCDGSGVCRVCRSVCVRCARAGGTVADTVAWRRGIKKAATGAASGFASGRIKVRSRAAGGRSSSLRPCSCARYCAWRACPAWWLPWGAGLRRHSSPRCCAVLSRHYVLSCGTDGCGHAWPRSGECVFSMTYGLP